MDTAKLMELMKNKKVALKQKAKTLKPNPGSNRYVLLPGWRKGEEYVWFHAFGQHFIKNAADDIQAVYPCLYHTYDGKACPVCEGLQQAIKAAPDNETVELLQKSRASGSYLMNVLALDGDEAGTPQILEVRKSVFTQMMDLLEEWAIGVFDPKEPQIIVINRDGKGLNTKYSVQISPKKHTLPANVLDKLNNLDDYVRQENEEQQRKAIGAINSVAGLLPPADIPRTSAAAEASLSAREAAADRPSLSSVELDAEIDELLGDIE